MLRSKLLVLVTWCCCSATSAVFMHHASCPAMGSVVASWQLTSPPLFLWARSLCGLCDCSVLVTCSAFRRRNLLSGIRPSFSYPHHSGFYSAASQLLSIWHIPLCARQLYLILCFPQTAQRIDAPQTACWLSGFKHARRAVITFETYHSSTPRDATRSNRRLRWARCDLSLAWLGPLKPGAALGLQTGHVQWCLFFQPNPHLSLSWAPE